MGYGSHNDMTENKPQNHCFGCARVGAYGHGEQGGQLAEGTGFRYIVGRLFARPRQMRRGDISGDMMPKNGQLYQQDFILWTKEQAGALRRSKGSNLPLDWENLAEEIESLGISQRTALNSQLRRILHHLFKLEASPARDPRAGWRATIRDARAEVQDLLEASPSLRREIDDVVKKQTAMAAKLAAADLEEHGERVDAVWAQLEKGGFTPEQTVDDWFPGA